jgi:hypothetical protein
MKKIVCIILALSLFVITTASTINKVHDLSKGIYLYASAESFIFFTNGKSPPLDNESRPTQKDYSFTVHANKEQLKKINELKGKKMTRLEFFEAVFPDIVAKLSDRQKKLYASMPYVFPGSQTSSSTSSSTAPNAGSSGR